MGILIPIIALSIPVVAIIMGSWVKVARLRLEAERGHLPSAETESRVAALEEEVGNLRRELGEAQERLDFTERLLTQRSEQQRLGS